MQFRSWHLTIYAVSFREMLIQNILFPKWALNNWCLMSRIYKSYFFSVRGSGYLQNHRSVHALWEERMLNSRDVSVSEGAARPIVHAPPGTVTDRLPVPTPFGGTY